MFLKKNKGADFKIISDTVNRLFSINQITTASNSKPINLEKRVIDCNISQQPRINNMLIKSKGQDIVLPDGVDDQIAKWVIDCIKIAGDVCDDIDGRYAYLTIDNKPVRAGGYQREGGWHLDGLQGDEVPSKLKNCFQFIWVSNTPTEFCIQSFDPKGIDISNDNVFKALGHQVKSENCFKINPSSTYLMHCFHVHRATASERDTQRLFLRLYLSHCPVTSVKASINHKIKYPFVYHSTTGEIPRHLN
jgi:hypothetical protein